jgi:hypothetical protein
MPIMNTTVPMQFKQNVHDRRAFRVAGGIDEAENSRYDAGADIDATYERIDQDRRS